MTGNIMLRIRVITEKCLVHWCSYPRLIDNTPTTPVRRNILSKMAKSATNVILSVRDSKMCFWVLLNTLLHRSYRGHFILHCKYCSKGFQEQTKLVSRISEIYNEI